MIDSGQARNVLSVHSSALTRVHKPVEFHSTTFGDGAAAAVIGRVPQDRGVLATIHNADGSLSNSLVLGVPGGSWWELGEITTYMGEHTRQMIWTLTERAGQTITEALQKAGITAANIRFVCVPSRYAVVCQGDRRPGGHRRIEDPQHVPRAGDIYSVNTPYVLAQAARKGLIRDGSIVVLFSGGLGQPGRVS